MRRQTMSYFIYFSTAEPEPEYSYYKQFSSAFSHAEPEPEPRYRRSPDDHHDHAPEGELFNVDTSLKTERGKTIKTLNIDSMCNAHLDG